MSVKRLNYFTHQFLREQDFKDEQTYHVAMRRHHNRIFHDWGVAEGLEVQKTDERRITISPGTAIDREGREIVLQSAVVRDLSSFNRDSDTYVTIGYNETWEEPDHYVTAGIEAYSRLTESPEILERKRQPSPDGDVVTLARVHLNDLGQIHHIDMEPSVRKRANLSPAAGWVRLPFKPVRLNPTRIGGVLLPLTVYSAEQEFIVDEANTYCGADGARGSMQIPVPPAASRVVAFRMAGTTKGKVEVHLFRSGWNPQDNKGESTQLLHHTLRGPTFHEDIPVDGTLNDYQALALSVYAEGHTNIWLVAARFA